ncbi:alpha/beta-hydrolase [Mycena rebaudengoi]|nr:alpha/beta-hydrolase [Mycena rebaudengoi]
MSPSLTTKRLISKDGTEILAEAKGNYSKPHVVFVHGFSSNGTAFDPIFNLDVLTENMYMVRYDMRGHGRSAKPERPEDYESIRYAEDFQAVIDGFNLNKPILAGWSLGATVLADVCAHIDPFPISAAIWIAPFVYMNRAPPPIREDFAGMLSSDAGTCLRSRIAFCAAFAAPGREVPFSDMLCWLGSTACVSPACMGLVLSKRQDLGQDFGPLKKFAAGSFPLFFIYGSEDSLTQCDDICENTKPLFADMEVAVMEGTGHIPFWEEPQVFAEHILRFVARICR